MEREEGELTDEDLEDVSDNSSLSIPIILSGKSPCLSTNREPFRELSLTSVSDDSDEKDLRYGRLIAARSRDLNHEVSRKHRHRREERKHTGIKRVRKLSERRVVRRRTSSLRKEYSNVSSSSEDSDYYQQNKHILRQLRDAVQINKSQSLPNCSLRTRIKRMIEPDSQGSKNSNSDDDNDLDTLRDLALQSKSKKDSASEKEEPMLTDKDLIELRLVALQSAVLKKHQNRRKNREEQLKKTQSADAENNVEKMTTEPAIKENVIENTNESTETKPDKIQNGDSKSNVVSEEKDNAKLNIDEDEAFLRAMLLSSISNQGKKEKVGEKSDNENDAILRSMLISTISNQENIENNVDNNSNNKHLKTDKTESTKSNIDDDEDILRAMLLANISKKIADKKSAKQINNTLNKNNTNINKSNKIISKAVTNPSDTKNTLKLPSVPGNRFIINLNSDSDSDCDQTKVEKKTTEKVVKNKDLFDKSLSLFLQQARAKSDAEYKSDISHLPKSQQLEYRRLKRKLQQLTRSKLKTFPRTKKIINPDENKLKLVNNINDKHVTNISNLPKTTLKTDEKLNNKDDSYRLQAKGKYEELGPLMTKVSDARVARDKAQTEVKRLINDLRNARAILTSSHQTYTILMQQLVAEKSLIDKRLDQEQENNNPPVCTSTPNKEPLLHEESKQIPCDLSAITQDQDEHVPEEDKTIIQEPEDMEIEEISEEEKKECSILKYSSPLDHIQLKREQPDRNPLSILCPYDLLGECRDPDCTFQHCGNAMTD